MSDDYEDVVGVLKYTEAHQAKTYMEDFIEQHFKKLGLPCICVIDYNLNERGYVRGPATIELYPRLFKSNLDPRKVEWGMSKFLDLTIQDMENQLREKGIIE